MLRNMENESQYSLYLVPNSIEGVIRDIFFHHKKADTGSIKIVSPEWTFHSHFLSPGTTHMAPHFMCIMKIIKESKKYGNVFTRKYRSWNLNIHGAYSCILIK